MLFVALGLLAYVTTAVATLLTFLWYRQAYDPVSNMTLLLSTAVAPGLTAGGAALLTQRRHLARWWIAVGAMCIEVCVWAITTGVGSMLWASQYQPVNIVALVLSVAVTLVAIWFDRRSWRLKGWARQWRLMGVGALFLVLILLLFAQAATYGADQSGPYLTSILVPLGIIAILAMIAALVFRGMPKAEMLKRIALVIAVVITATLGVVGLVGVAGFSTDAAWVPFAAGAIVYVESLHLLRQRPAAASKKRK